jgi:ABC-type nitrate/sulfonate/bicarbonate transport system permease component
MVPANEGLRTMPSTTANRGLQLFGRRLRPEGIIALVGLAVVWQIVSYFTPPVLFPSVPQIAARFVEIFSSWSTAYDAVATGLRILAGLTGAFLLGSVLAMLMARSDSFERYCYPLLNFNQGIPALSWVVISIIWFRGIEFRIFFIMVMTTLPAFAFQVLDSYRSMSKDLFEMTLAFRPSRYDLFRTLIWPTVLPGILTAWKVNLGNASRVVVVAELVGATGGVGYELLQQQQIFDMAGAVAWTIVLVVFVLGVQGIISAIEAHALAYRAAAERTL